MKTLKMAVFLVLALFVFISVEVQAADLRGNWQVVASGHNAVWLIGLEGDTIYGASKWSCCPSFRVDRISGSVFGNEIIITRHINKQGSPSGTQTYKGTISNGKITGSWSGLGGSGQWTAVISK